MSITEQIKAVQRFHGLVPDGIPGSRTWAAIFADVQSRADVPVEADDSEAPDLDERTMKNIRTLDPKAQDRFIQFSRIAKGVAASMGCDYVMISGQRSWADQDALYAQGRTKPGPVVTKARGGYSNHNFAIAGDYGVFRGKSYLDNADTKLAAQVHAAVAVHARRLGFEWGGDWKGLKDFPHFEISTGLSMAEKRDLWKRKGSVL